MDRDDAIVRLRSSGLADRIDRIEPYLRPCVRIRASPAPDVGKALVSRFAGHGVLPRGMAWPMWDSTAYHQRCLESHRARTGDYALSTAWRETLESYEAQVRDNPKPLYFLAMVRLAEIARHAAQLGLPDHGVLLFFYDLERSPGAFWPEARGAWQVIFAPDERELAVVDEPPVHIPEFVPCTMTFEQRYSLPEDLRHETGDAELSAWGESDYERVHHELLGITSTGDTVHLLGGVPQEVQSGLFQECQLASNGVDCGSPEDLKVPKAQELAPGTRDWRLILQIDSDEAGPGWMFGDSGRLYFCAHKDDLAARRFDRTWCVEQCC